MELTVLEGEGIPEGAILSIRCGAMHCQTPMELKKPIYVPYTLQNLGNNGEENLNHCIGFVFRARCRIWGIMVRES
jgi:hypothetical protein